MRKVTVVPKSHVVKREKIINLSLGSGVIILFLIGWELLFQCKAVNPLFISAPSRVILALITIIRDGSLFQHLGISANEFLLGYGLAIVIGFPLGIMLGWFKLIRAAFGPFIAAMQATPRIALMPLFIIWFGLGITSKIVVVLLSAIFPLIVNLQVAMSTIDSDLVHVAQAYGASRWKIFRTIALPTSLPFLITGLRLAAGRGLLGVIVAEVFGGAEGIGYMIQYAGSTFQTDKVFAGVLVVAVTGISLDFTLDRLGRYFDRWRSESAVH